MAVWHACPNACFTVIPVAALTPAPHLCGPLRCNYAGALAVRSCLPAFHSGAAFLEAGLPLDNPDRAPSLSRAPATPRGGRQDFLVTPRFRVWCVVRAGVRSALSRGGGGSQRALSAWPRPTCECMALLHGQASLRSCQLEVPNEALRSLIAPPPSIADRPTVVGAFSH